MKKIVVLSLMILVGCSPKADLVSLEWKKGDSAESLKALQGLTFSSQAQVRSLNQSIQLQEQTYKGLVLENSFLKRIKSQNQDELLIRAAFAEDQQALDRLSVSEFIQRQSSIKKDLQKAFPIFRRINPDSIEAVISNKPGFYEGQWRIIYADQKGVPWELRLNRNLEVRSVQRVGSHFHETQAWVYPQGPKKSVLQEVNLSNLQIQPALSNARLFVGSQADLKVTSGQESLKFPVQDSRFDQVQVFYFLEESLKWFEKKLNVRIPFQIQAEIYVGAPEKTNSAFYYQGKIRLGQGDGEVYARIPQDPSIVVHESVHALIDAVARLPFEGEGGSLNEGFADFFTALQLNSPHMGEVAYLKGPFKRTLLNDRTVSDRNGGLYHDSGIISGTLWELATKFGPEKGMKLGILTLNRLVPVSDFKDFGESLRLVLPEVLAQAEDLEAAKAILSKRGF